MKQPMKLQGYLDVIRMFPESLEALVGELKRHQLDSPWHNDGWTIRKIIHHVVDSHVNIYSRMRFILTEDHPTIKPFDEDSWGDLPDVHTGSTAASLAMLKGLHLRTAELLEGLQPEAFDRGGYHPEIGDMTLLDFVEAMSEHSTHHLNQIERILTDKGWHSRPELKSSKETA